MNNPTDTNQASEELKQRLSDTKTFNYNVYFGVDGGDYAISFDEAIDEIVSLIRTEKLKLLAEVRERVIEQAKPDERKATSWQQGIEVAAYEDAVRVYEYKMNERLTKLEAEL